MHHIKRVSQRKHTSVLLPRAGEEHVRPLGSVRKPAGHGLRTLRDGTAD